MPSIDTRDADLVRVLWSDLHGVPRGKDIAAAELRNVAETGLAFCQALMVTDLSAEPLDVAESSGRGWPDGLAVPDLDTLRFPSHAPGYAIVLADVLDPVSRKPLDVSPRDLLRAQVSRFTERGLHPVAAPELEFYVCAPDQQAPHRWVRYLDHDSAGYVVGGAYDPSGLLPDLLRHCRALNLGTIGGFHEYTGGQFEINQVHSAALDACDRTFLFKHVVKEVAAGHGLRATFMGLPFTGRSGSGGHIHLSLTDPEGRSLFATADGGLSDLALAFLAGILEHAAGLTAILNPSINAFKRLRAGALVPRDAGWGLDDRTALVRVPPERGAGTRLETRVGDGILNPYLGVAALLAAGLDGIDRQLAPPPARASGAPLPESLAAALTALEQDKALGEALGGRFVELFTALKRQEIDRYERTVTDWEFHEYSWQL
ncbi:glutamine synthetase family protein [Actinoallomurus sp. CA-150999]|uniref:glutamine synthetase family protein n=1 Tax=Actinoallomurus sp. CA-150999 TaxID=3239887 RepID=UPI003D8E6CC9